MLSGIVIEIVDLVQAILRHLEVRWQLFNEALSRFRDLEAMLAICAGNMPTIYRHKSTLSGTFPRVDLCAC